MAIHAGVNRARQFALLMSPKCGTRTLNRWFESTIVEAERTPQWDQRRLGERIRDHTVEAKRLADPEFSDFLVIFAVRDPHRRMVSAYLDVVVGRPEEWGQADGAGNVRLDGVSFRTFIETVARLHSEGVMLQHHLQPQVVNVPAGRVDRHILTERLEEELAALSTELGIDHSQLGWRGRTRYVDDPNDGGQLVADLPAAAHSGRIAPRPRRFYDRALYDLVSEVYPDDAALYRSIPAAWPLEIART
ncbi:MAG: sulfotransferase family 2 domain-containing protein [Acidimicrobiales bacterium]